MNNRDNIEIIVPSHGLFFKHIKNLGYNVVDPFYGRNVVLRILREIFFRFRLPLKSLFYNKKAICSNKTIILFESLITVDYLKWLHNRCLSSDMIIIYANKVGSSINPNKVGDWCVKWTYDKDDADKYNMHLYNGGIYFPQWKVEKKSPKYDVFYVGKDKNRLDRLRTIESEMNKYGAKTMFYITWERGWQKKNDGIHKPFLSYEKVLDYIGKSKAILHLIDGAQNGITLRIQESLLHKVKLVTDDASISTYDFYNPQNIFILGVDNMEDFPAFLESPYQEVESEFFNHAYFDQMIKEMIEVSLGK